MSDTPNVSTTLQTQIAKIIVSFLQSHGTEVLAESWKLLQKLWRGWSSEGLYEVLEHHSALELLDKNGRRALVRKRQKVRYLQNNILAYQDQAWGDGEILLNYQCAPGVPADKYRPANKTYILISLREVKDKGDVDEFHIQWGIRHGFLRETEMWSAEISHRTRFLKLDVIFPAQRPPIRVALVEGPIQKVTLLPSGTVQKLADGRYCASWEILNPGLYKTFGLQWDW